MKKLRQKQRTTRIFIEAAAEIIKNEGVDALTIRKVADEAAYNSATIYNYFNNLEHLKSLASLMFMKEYTDELDDCVSNAKNAYEINQLVWLCFYKHSFRMPKIYSAIFGNSANKEHNSYINDFYTLFPDHLTVKSPKVKGMIVEENLFDRTMFLLRGCADEGYFRYEDLEEIYELLFFVYQGMLNKLLFCPECLLEDEFIEKAEIYNNRVLKSYLQKKEL